METKTKTEAAPHLLRMGRQLVMRDEHERAGRAQRNTSDVSPCTRILHECAMAPTSRSPQSVPAVKLLLRPRAAASLMYRPRHGALASAKAALAAPRRLSAGQGADDRDEVEP
jgi:hypothetical protein